MTAQLLDLFGLERLEHVGYDSRPNDFPEQSLITESLKLLTAHQRYPDPDITRNKIEHTQSCTIIRSSSWVSWCIE